MKSYLDFQFLIVNFHFLILKRQILTAMYSFWLKIKILESYKLLYFYTNFHVSTIILAGFQLVG